MDAKQEGVIPPAEEAGATPQNIMEDKSSPTEQKEGGHKDDEEYAEEKTDTIKNNAEGGQPDSPDQSQQQQHQMGAGVTENAAGHRYMQLQEAVGFLQGIGEQKIILAQTQNANELIVGRFDLSKQEAIYTFDGKEQVAQVFKIVDGLLLPKGEKAEEEDAIGYQTQCPNLKWQGKHWCGLAETPQGLVPGKVMNDTCWYSLDGKEVETKDFHYVVVKSVDGEPMGSASFMSPNNQNTIQYTGSSRNNLMGPNALYNLGANPNEMIDQLPSDYIYTEMFKAFDVEQQGVIQRVDMDTAAKALGWKTEQLDELIYELDQNHSGQITFEEFVLMMKYIEQKQSQLPPIGQSTLQGQSQSHDNLSATNSKSFLKAGSSIMSQEMSIYEMDKKKYGALLPKTGVYFLPDERIVAFLKIMNEIRKRYEAVGDYMMANKFKKTFDRWSDDEQERQSHNMRIAQQRELINIEQAQKVQYTEFAEAWDKYMADYEATAFNLVENLKVRQMRELDEMRKIITEKFYNDHRWNKQIIELRKQERIYFSIKDYVNAEKVKLICQSLEKKEVDDMQEQLHIKLTKEETTLRQKQSNQMQALLRRIQRDREEQVKHRQVDSNRLIQRNKNLLNDILEKQGTEKRRTQNFLKYSLRKREEKSDDEIKQSMKNSAYDPKADPLMPRLFRKFDSSKSTILSHRKTFQTMSSKERFDNSKSYQAGQGYGSQRTYLCINPYRQMSKNKHLASQMRSLANDETERALIQLEDNYNSATGKNFSLPSGNYKSIDINNLNQPSIQHVPEGSPKRIELPSINK